MKMLFGGVYRRKWGTPRNDQSYGLYIPVIKLRDDGIIGYRMVDTHMVRNPCWGKTDMEKRLWYLEQANRGETSGMIYYGPSNYYYSNYFELNSDELNENEWELVIDLHDCKIVDDRDANEYLEQDVVRYLPLWHEDNYRWSSGGVGCNYVKKNAQKDGYKVYLNGLRNYSFGFADYCARDTIEVCEKVLQNMKVSYGKKKEIKKTIKKAKKYLKLSDEYYRYCAELDKKKETKQHD